MKNKINNIIQSFVFKLTDKVISPNTIILFKKAVYIYIILNGLISLPLAAEIWGPDSYLIHYYPVGNWGIKFLNIISRPDVNTYYLLFVIGQMICSIVALLGYMKRLMSVLLYFLSVNLYYSAGIIQNAGPNVLFVILFYMIFMNEDASDHKNVSIKSSDIGLTNFALITAQIQICVIYFVSAVYKLLGPHWLDGSALYYVLHIEEFTTNWVITYIADRDWLTIPITYLTVIFQLAFPITVWIKKLKPLTLWVGIAFHVLIILVMGLTDFGLIMLIMYLLFVNDAKSKMALNKLKIV